MEPGEFERGAQNLATTVGIAICLQLQADLLRIQIECADLKEYDMSWLPGGKKVTRDGGTGQFAKKASADPVSHAKAENNLADLEVGVRKIQLASPVEIKKSPVQKVLDVLNGSLEAIKKIKPHLLLETLKTNPKDVLLAVSAGAAFAALIVLNKKMVGGVGGLKNLKPGSREDFGSLGVLGLEVFCLFKAKEAISRL